MVTFDRIAEELLKEHGYSILYCSSDGEAAEKAAALKKAIYQKGGMCGMIHLAEPNLEGNERAYLNRCIDSTFISSAGGFVNQMEEMTAKACGAQYASAASSGTAALHLALMGAGTARDDIVIIPSFTFIATANAVAHCGAVPWLMDIEENTWGMDAWQLEDELKHKTKVTGGRVIHRQSGRRVAAVMPVYTLGSIPDMDKIRKTAAEYGLPVIADAACAIGAQYHGMPVGDIADISAISFNGNKTVTAGGGGMVVGNDESVMRKIKHISTTARISAEYEFDMTGYNYRMTNLQAAVGCAQMERLEELVEKKRAVRRFYKEKLSDISEISCFPDLEGQYHTCWFSGIVLKHGGLAEVREICSSLGKYGIEARSFWKPVHLQKPYIHSPRAENLNVSEEIWDRIITLPCSTGIKEKELQSVSDALHRIFTDRQKNQRL